ncbi:MAG TPA: tRNA (adenosine(37)-N6)-threonylcarbamoyltransferase complex ATPase subunit type 1 TsaE [Casimicrobiaceae bacterium]
MHTLELYLPDAAATARAGAAFAPLLNGGMIVTLQGDLGAGKTTLVRGVLRARGQKGPIKSPSYGLVEHYPFSSIYFYHIDFYRFDNPAEWETAGLAECFRPDTVCLIEWPEHAGTFLPRADVALLLSLAQSDEGRTLTAHAYSESGEQCVAAMAAKFGVALPLR